MGGPPRLLDRDSNSKPPVPFRPPAPRDRADRDGSQGPLPVRGRQDPGDLRALDGPRTRPADGGHPGRLVLSDDGGGEPPPDGGGAAAFGPPEGPPPRDGPGGPRGRPRPPPPAGPP